MSTPPGFRKEAAAGLLAWGACADVVGEEAGCPCVCEAAFSSEESCLKSFLSLFIVASFRVQCVYNWLLIGQAGNKEEKRERL